MSAGRHLAGAHGAQIAPGAPDTSGTSSTPGGPGGPERGDRLEAAASVLALLADRTRLALMERLGRGEADVTTLTEACGAARPSVSQHLAKLRLAGLVTTRKDGRRVVYALGHGHLRRLVDEALNVADHQLGSLPPHD
ncbi:ArsR/SmtB family transcription factor [Streptomyces sp. NPDC058682]|uniref:ArsR/SmtB family transcription factor n=1 Tax=Streptomyces sp. NPDC058682 TaxID=3346596 RepID=UPI00364D7B87